MTAANNDRNDQNPPSKRSPPKRVRWSIDQDSTSWGASNGDDETSLSVSTGHSVSNALGPPRKVPRLQLLVLPICQVSDITSLAKQCLFRAQCLAIYSLIIASLLIYIIFTVAMFSLVPDRMMDWLVRRLEASNPDVREQMLDFIVVASASMGIWRVASIDETDFEYTEFSFDWAAVDRFVEDSGRYAGDPQRYLDDLEA